MDFFVGCHHPVRCVYDSVFEVREDGNELQERRRMGRGTVQAQVANA